MNCLDFRRSCLTEPQSTDPDFVAHAQSCGDCKKFRDDILAFDQKLSDAMAVPVPDSLEAEILLRHSIREFNHKRVWWSGAVAAMILVGVMTLSFFNFPTSSSLATELMVHTLEEPFKENANPVSKERLNELLAKRTAFRFKGDLARVVSARYCDVQGKLSAHLIVATDHGRVDVFLMPGQIVGDGGVFAHDKKHGHLFTYKETGGIAVVGDSMSGVKAVESQLLASLDEMRTSSNI